MKTKAEVLELVQLYQKQFKSETERLQPFIRFIDCYDNEDLFCRKNFTGHITASAFIINPAGDALLLLQHKSLNRWLQPGGHVDAADVSLLEASLREVEEETGIIKDDLHLVHPAIFDIDSHHIPANLKKHEPPHIHHDVRFLFRYSKTHSLHFNPVEANACKWVPIKSLPGNTDLCIVADKIIAELQYGIEKQNP